MVRIEDAGAEARVSVSDRGRGIPTGQLPRLFERFYRVDAAQAARSLGLGLYITRGIVVNHSGRFWAESDGVGSGSRFIFTLPYQESPANRAAVKEDRERVPASSRTRTIQGAPAAT